MSVKLTEQEGLRQIGNGQPASPINEGRFQGSVGVDWQRVESQVLQVQELTWRSWSTALEDTSFQRWFADWLSAIQQSGLQWRKKGGPKFTELIQLLISNEEREIGAEEVEAMVKALPLRWIEHVEVMQKIDRHGTDSAPRVRELVSRIDALSSEVILEVYPYVARISRRYCNRLRSASLSPEDLASRAYFAIPMAFRSWDPKRGPFQMALRLWITQEMADELLAQSTVHEPEQVNFIRTRLRESEYSLRQTLQRQPTAEELAEHSGQPPNVVQGLISRPLEMVSMDAGSERDVPGQYASSLHDVLPADDADPFLVASGSLDRKQALNEIKRLLEPRLRRTNGALGFQLPLHLIHEAEGEALPLPEALDLLREIGYENLRAKLNRQKAN